MKRPTSVSVIAWILIVMSGISLVTSTFTLNNPIARETATEIMAKSLIPIPLQFVMLYAGLLITVVSGIAMLKRQNWARLLYVFWGAMGFMISVLTSPMKPMMIPGIIFFLVVAFFLFRPKANEYFSTRDTLDDAKSV